LPADSKPVPGDLAPALDRALRTKQADRLPSVAAAVVREGELAWSGAAGLADCEGGVEATPEMQYRVGSITKTFTAVAVMQLRDAGKLDLDDRIGEHLPEVAKGSPTIRRLLAHISGLQREAGEMFATGAAPTIEEVLAAMESYEEVLPAARAHHYSNLGYGLLGEIIARASGGPYTEYVDREILAPLGLERTTWSEQAPHAFGYLVDDFAGTAAREPHSDMRGIAAMGQLWSTVGDLCRWVAFLADGREGVLDPATADEMWAPQVMMNPDDWVAGWGLGLELVNVTGKVYGGHGGAMPGFLAGLYLNRESKVGAAVLANSGTRAPTRELAIELAGITLDKWPAAIEAWKPEPAPPPEVAAILGHWWSEGMEFVFAWRNGKLVSEIPGAPPRVKPAVFEPLPDGGWRVVSGRERGERLRVEGDRMIWAGYPFTRTQEATPG
jgi:CubicO group peptidase (beta-lactamase class C family)